MSTGDRVYVIVSWSSIPCLVLAMVFDSMVLFTIGAACLVPMMAGRP